MPQHRRRAEPLLEAVEEILGQRDLGQQDEHLPPHPQRLRNGFEIGLGLARSGNPVEQEGSELRRAHRLAEYPRSLALLRAQRDFGEIGVRGIVGPVAIDLDRFEHALVDQPAQHAFGDARDARKFADIRLLAFERVDRRLPLRGHAFGHPPGQAVFGHCRRALERAPRRQRHARHARERGDIIVGGPFDQPAQRCRQRRDGQQAAQIAQLLHRNFGPWKPFGFPDNSDYRPRTQRAFDNRTRFDHHAFGHLVIERAESGIENEAAHAVHGPAIWAGAGA